MKQEKFNSNRQDLFNKCIALTEKKGNDYTKGNEDVLIHFKESGASFGLTKYQSLGIFMKKHMDAIYNYIKTEGQAESEPIETRITDAINFLTFLHSMIEEDADTRKSKSK
jgi:hypothetical protein